MFNRRRLVAAYHDVFTSESGQIVLHDLMRRGHFFRSTHDPRNSQNSPFLEGERNLVLHILAYLGKNEQDVRKLHDEAYTYRIGDNDD